MTDCASTPVNDFCPTQAELQPQLLAMLPRGRAWGEGTSAREPGGVIYQFWWAVAGVYAAVHAALCALALEFVCSTATLTLDLWDREYGLPDACDPYANLCAKVAALGGVTCAYYEEIAAALGWSIVCGAPCSAPLGICFRMGSTPLGPVSSAATLIVVVDLENSPAFEGVQGYGIRMGCYAMGQANTCGPDLTALDCVLQRIVGAHVTLDYVTF